MPLRWDNPCKIVGSRAVVMHPELSRQPWPRDSPMINTKTHRINPTRRLSEAKYRI